MNRTVWALVLVVMLVLVPAQAFALDGMERVTVTISFFSLGLGTVGLVSGARHRQAGGWIVGGFQIAVGILGLILVATDSLGGDLLAQIREEMR